MCGADELTLISKACNDFIVLFSGGGESQAGSLSLRHLVLIRAFFPLGVSSLRNLPLIEIHSSASGPG